MIWVFLTVSGITVGIRNFLVRFQCLLSDPRSIQIVICLYSIELCSVFHVKVSFIEFSELTLGQNIDFTDQLGNSVINGMFLLDIDFCT